MKNLFWIFISAFLLTNCTQEPNLENYSVIPISGKNKYASIFLERLQERQQAEEELNRLLNNRTPLFEHTTIGQSDCYGIYYMIPLQDLSSSIINSALIYPVDTRKSDNEKSYNGTLDVPPTFFDSQVLNKEIPITARFLYSYHFLEWQKEGLNVLADLTSFAEKLDGHEMEIDCTQEFTPRTKAISYGWSYEIMIRYEVVAQWGDPGGEATITQLHFELADEAFKDCMSIFSTYPLRPIKIYGPYAPAWGTKLISLYYPEKVPNIKQLAHQYMNQIQGFTRFTFRYQISTMEMRGDETRSGSGSTSGSGGGSSGGSGNNDEKNTNGSLGPQGTLSKAIFSPQSKLTKEQWGKIELVLEYINRDCMGGKLVSSLTSRNILLAYDPNLKDKFGAYNPQEHKLTIKDFEERNIDESLERTLIHELIHCIQRPTTTGQLNYEVEAHVATYLYASRTGRIAISGKKYENMEFFCDSIDKNYNILDQEQFKQGYLNILNSLRNNGYKNYSEDEKNRNFATVKKSEDC